MMNKSPESLLTFADTLKIKCSLGEEVCVALKFENSTPNRVAWKIKTNRRNRYMMRPTQGIIESGTTGACEIFLVPMQEYPDISNPKNIKDKFLIQSVVVSNDFTNEELSELWKEKAKLHKPKDGKYAYKEEQVRCVLMVPRNIQETMVSSLNQPATERLPSDSVLNVERHLSSTSGEEESGNGTKEKLKFDGIEIATTGDDQYIRLLDYVGKLSDECKVYQESISRQQKRNKILQAKIVNLEGELGLERQKSSNIAENTRSADRSNSNSESESAGVLRKRIKNTSLIESRVLLADSSTNSNTSISMKTIFFILLIGYILGKMF
eukprot:134467_1